MSDESPTPARPVPTGDRPDEENTPELVEPTGSSEPVFVEPDEAVVDRERVEIDSDETVGRHERSDVRSDETVVNREPVDVESDEARVEPVVVEHEPVVVERPIVIEHEPVVVEPAEASSEEPVAATTDPGAADLRSTGPVAPVQTVYVQAPVPPRRKGNRAVGSLIALLSAIVFAAVYAAVALVVMPLLAPRGASFAFTDFVVSDTFLVPVGAYIVGFILLVLIANRANWWAYLLGSFFVAVFVYAASAAVLLLMNNVVGMTPDAAATAARRALSSPLLIIAAIVAREVSLWIGAAIAARGRRVKIRNAEAREAFEQETADQRAEYDRSRAGGSAY
jgi:hypothetical protein